MMALKIGDFVDAQKVPKRWYLLRVRPNHEAKVLRAFELRKIDISGYVPMIPRTRVVTRISWSGREVRHQHQVKVPLFPGLIIISQIDAREQRWRGVDGTFGLHRTGPCESFLDEKRYADVLNIEAIGNVPPSKRERMYATGQLVRIVDGPFKFFVGKIERLDSRGRLSVLIELFGRMSLAELEQGQIEVV